MFRQRTGSVVCASCGSLVGVNDDKCYTCGRRNPGLWGFGPVLRRFGNDLGFVSLVVYGCAVLYTATLLITLL
jgi:rhomboid protease GluP